MESPTPYVVGVTLTDLTKEKKTKEGYDEESTCVEDTRAPSST
jgi:hypothetical protein